MENELEQNGNGFFEDDSDFDQLCMTVTTEINTNGQTLTKIAEPPESSDKSDLPKEKSMTNYQKDRAEKNRMKAVALKQARLQAHPYSKKEMKTVTGEKITKEKEKKLIDGGGGFFIEEDDENDEPLKIVEVPAPIMPPDQPTCLECKEDFADSYLYTTFDHSVCDKCRNTEKDGDHELITKSDSKNTFLLRDSDFEDGERGKALKFILRKNPHNPRWGDMKLFLRLQIEKRAMEIWGSEEALEEEHEKREEKKEAAKTKKFTKQIKKLRMQVRSSLFKKDLSTHVHEYGEETYDEEKDEYSKTCDGCGHVNTYEKM